MCETTFTKFACKHLTTTFNRCLLNSTKPILLPKDCPAPGGHVTTTLRSSGVCPGCRGERLNSTPLLGSEQARPECGAEVRPRLMSCGCIGRRCGEGWLASDLEESVPASNGCRRVWSEKGRQDSAVSGFSDATTVVEDAAEPVQGLGVSRDVPAIVLWSEVDWENGGSGGHGQLISAGHHEISPKSTTFRDWMKWGHG